MQQYICDRCGEAIPTYTRERNRILFYDKDVHNTQVQYFNSRYNDCDLCDDCLEYLHNMNKAFYELDEKYFKIAEKRLNECVEATIFDK